jgi:hypothetical protein
MYEVRSRNVYNISVGKFHGKGLPEFRELVVRFKSICVLSSDSGWCLAAN